MISAVVPVSTGILSFLQYKSCSMSITVKVFPQQPEPNKQIHAAVLKNLGYTSLPRALLRCI